MTSKSGRTCISLRLSGWTFMTCSPLALSLLGPAGPSSVTAALWSDMGVSARTRIGSGRRSERGEGRKHSHWDGNRELERAAHHGEHRDRLRGRKCWAWRSGTWCRGCSWRMPEKRMGACASGWEYAQELWSLGVTLWRSWTLEGTELGGGGTRSLL